MGKGLAKAKMFEVEEEGDKFVESLESLSGADCRTIATYATRSGWRGQRIWGGIDKSAVVGDITEGIDIIALAGEKSPVSC